MLAGGRLAFGGVGGSQAVVGLAGSVAAEGYVVVCSPGEIGVHLD